MTKRTITIERTYDGSIDDVWDLWTTKGGLEAWWGPEGFRVEVRKLELRPGGALDYAMIASAPPQIEFMKKAGMPLSHEAHVKYTEVVPKKLLVYDHVVDFVPGIEPYVTATRVELFATATGVRLVLNIDPMHDETWTARATMGWESELGKLAGALASRRS